MKSTYSLKIITETICKDDAQIDIVIKTLEDALAVHQWYYQNASKYQQQKNAKNGAKLAVAKTIELLKAIGQNSLAEEVERVLPDDRMLTKIRVISNAKKAMKEIMLNKGISESTYNNKFAVLMEEAFKEQCSQYPLKEPPTWFDNNFEP